MDSFIFNKNFANSVMYGNTCMYFKKICMVTFCLGFFYLFMFISETSL